MRTMKKKDIEECWEIIWKRPSICSNGLTGHQIDQINKALDLACKKGKRKI